MQLEQSRITAQDGQSIMVLHWRPDPSKGRAKTPLRGVVQISHGMAEHCARYAYLAERLAEAGFATVAHDHRGHGMNKGGRKGHYGDEEGWTKVIDDLASVRAFAVEHYPDLPIFLLGHSMGSFISLGMLERKRPPYTGVILSGSDFTPPLKFKLAQPIARAERALFGAGGRSPVMSFLSFGSFNKDFKPKRTPFDWLSRDPAQVDRYINDPLCGFDCTNQLWVDLLEGLAETFSAQGLKRLEDRPYYLFAGDKDPVGQRGQGVLALTNALKKAGIHDVTTRLYAEGRHEMLNESNRDEVIGDLIIWINQQVNKP